MREPSAGSKVRKQCPQTITFEDKRVPKWIRTEVPLLASLPPYRQAEPAQSDGRKTVEQRGPHERSVPLALPPPRQPPCKVKVKEQTARVDCVMCQVTSAPLTQFVDDLVCIDYNENRGTKDNENKHHGHF